jgi:hypothetical protein
MNYGEKNTWPVTKQITKNLIILCYNIYSDYINIIE